MIIKKLLLVVLFFQLGAHLNAQSLLTDTLSTRYYPATEEPNASWKNIDFDDASWNTVQGIQLFGYGDYPSVEVPKITSLYVRSFFNVDDIDNFKELVMYCDYDDGFVAYINGVEFARVNMGKYKTPTTYIQLADRSHELEITGDVNYPVWGYYIDSNFIKSNIVVGKNVLSVEVHNDSIDGSDLGIVQYLVDNTNAYYNYYQQRYKKCIELDSTQLPIIAIEIGEYGVPYAKESDGSWMDVPAKIEIFDNSTKLFNTASSENRVHEGDITIRYRGQSSADFPKHDYKIELKDSDGKDTSISLLGMPGDSDWILQGSFTDKSQIRNAFIYEMGRKTGHWTPRTKFVNLIVNGEYVGLYNLIEQIKRDSNRVDIAKLKEDEISGADLSGGYILKYDKPNNYIVQIVYPNNKNIKPEQETYIRDFISKYESVLKTNDGLDAVNGYKKYIDSESLIDYIIISELGKNADSYRFSTYFYKDKDREDQDGLIKYGPLWDFDLCFGNTQFQDGHLTAGWQFEFPGSNVFKITRLFQDTELTKAFSERWFELRKGFLHTDSIISRIDQLYYQLALSIKENYEIWPIIEKDLFYPAYSVSSYDEEIGIIKDWITARTAWIDANIDDIFYEVKDYTDVNDAQAYDADQFSANVYPNPFSKEFYIDLIIPTSGNLQIEIINIQGKVVGIIENAHVEKGNYKVYWNKGSENIGEGLNIVSIRIDGKLYDQIKVINLGK